MSEKSARHALVLTSIGRASDAGYLAAADLAVIASDLGVEYRLIGGNAVSLLVAVHGVSDLVPSRETADADFGAPHQVVADRRLPDALRRLATGGMGATFRRGKPDRVGELDLVIDVLAPSYEGRLITNQHHGDLVVDEVPGLALALARPSTTVDVEVRLTSGETLQTRLALPDVVSALCLKSYAYRGRYQPRDALDIWRLLEAASAAGIRAREWPSGAVAVDAARIMRDHFSQPNGAGLTDATSSRPQQTRIRALVAQVVRLP